MTAPKPPKESDEQREQEMWYERTRYQVLLFAGGIALFVLVGGWILDWYINPQTSGQKKDLVQALGLITAGVAGAVGIFFTWRGQRLAREAQEANQENTLAQLEHTRNELDITRRGQITERFTQAIEQLGSQSLEIRLGGIYSLERTARDSREDHWPVMEVLTTYVRQHTLRKTDKESNEEDIPVPEPDVQAILTVLGRRSVYHKDVEYGPIDLHNVDLRGADLTNTNLAGANLRGANLARANLRESDLRGAILFEANLEGVSLERADLQEVVLTTAPDRPLRGVPPNFRHASLFAANLEGTGLWFVDFREASLEHANLREAELWNADLSDVPLWGANLQRTGLEGANLRRAGFAQADMREARLFEADVRGALLQGALNLTQEQIEEALGDQSTSLPDPLKSPRIGT